MVCKKYSRPPPSPNTAWPIWMSSVAPHAGFIRDLAASQLMLGGPDHGDLRDRMDANGEVMRHGARWNAKGMTGRQPPLFRGGRRQTGETDDVAGCEDMGYLRAELLVHREASALVGLETGSPQVQTIGGTNSADGKEGHVRDD